MTFPGEEQDVDIPLRLQPVVARPGGWRGRSINLVALGLVGFVVVGLVLGTALDNGAPASSQAAAVPPAETASPRPTRRPTPTPEPLATPLPTLEVNGPRPDERRLVYGYGQEILDLATGTLRSFGRQYEDAIWQVGDELACICLVRPPNPSTDAPPRLDYGRFDLTGARLAEHELVSLEGVVAVPDMTEGFNTAAAFEAASGRIILLDVVRRPPDWVVELHVIDAAGGELLDSRVLETIPVGLDEPAPSPTPSPRVDGGPPDGVYAWAGGVSVAPGGGSVFVTVSASEVSNGEWTDRSMEWFVPIVDGRSGEPTPVAPDAALGRDRWCVGRPTYIDADLLIQVCTPPPDTVQRSTMSVRRLNVDGTSLGDLPIGAATFDGSSALSPIVDRARRSVLQWDAFRHLVSRVNVDDGRAHEGVVPESMLSGERGPTGRGWIGVDPGLILSADGERLYALGLAAGPNDVGSTTGIWVFDAETLELLDHWEPRALLTSIALSADGQYVYAAGAAGYEVEGRVNERWPASLTVYDARTGSVVVLYGAIGNDGQWLMFPPSY